MASNMASATNTQTPQSPTGSHNSNTKSKPRTLFETAKAITPEERKTLIRGPRIKITIVTDGGKDHSVLISDVPEAMILKFVPQLKWYLDGPANKQFIPLEENAAEQDGVRALINWMKLNCTTTNIVPLKTPYDLVSAIMLHRALKAMLLFADARRVNKDILRTLRTKPTHPNQIAEIWNRFPRNSDHVYYMIKDAGIRRANSTVVRPAEFEKVIRADPELFLRVTKKEENDKFMPVKETPEQYEARRQVEKAQLKEEKAERAEEKKAREEARKASHEAYLQRQARREASHQAYLAREARREQQKENDPYFHQGGAWEKEAKPGQYTRTGMKI